jgi:hypothetical protein
MLALDQAQRRVNVENGRVFGQILEDAHSV